MNPFESFLSLSRRLAHLPYEDAFTESGRKELASFLERSSRLASGYDYVKEDIPHGQN